MTTAPSKDIAEILVNGGLCTLGTDLFIPELPSSPDACVSISDIPSGVAIYDDVERPGVQILVRGDQNEYIVAYEKAHAIMLLMLASGGATHGESRYAGIWHVSGPHYLGFDTQKRPMFSLNFRTMR